MLNKEDVDKIIEDALGVVDNTQRVPTVKKEQPIVPVPKEGDDIDKDYAYTYNLILQNNTDKIRQGMTVTQMLDSAENISITGEVSNYNNTTKVLSLIHVGATDGKFHNFITTRTVSIPGVGGFGITSVAEDNKVSNNEQNDDFSTLTDFLDFTENNPFGDPENN